MWAWLSITNDLVLSRSTIGVREIAEPPSVIAVHGPGRDASPQDLRHLIYRFQRLMGNSLRHEPPDVRSGKHVGDPRETGRWEIVLRAAHVQRGPGDLPRLQRMFQRLLVDQSPSGRIHEEARRLHLPKRRGVHQ